MAKAIAWDDVTEPLTWALTYTVAEVEGESVYDLTDATDLTLHTRVHGSAAVADVDEFTTPKFEAIGEPTEGVVAFLREDTDLDPGLYDMRITLTDRANKTVAFPSDGWDELTLLAAF